MVSVVILDGGQNCALKPTQRNHIQNPIKTRSNTLMRIMIDFYVIYLRPMSVYGLYIHIHEFAGMRQFVM